MSTKRPTLRDVAHEAQLSVTQVSRALNGHSDVAEATRLRAREAAERLGYVPNLEARRLKAPDTRSHTIGLILPTATVEFSDPFFGELVAGIVAESAGRGYELQLSTPVDHGDPVEPYEHAIRHKRVDGFILVRTEDDDPRVRFLQARRFPFVVFGRPEGMTGFPSVDLPTSCMTEPVNHLVDLGHARIACVAEPRGYSLGAQRLGSFRRAAQAHGLDVDDLIVDAGFGEQAGFDAAMELLQRADRPTAITTLNDLLALGALHAAEELRLEVPDQLSVVGFDDIAAAALVRPGLTTLRQSARQAGAVLVKELMPGIEGGSLSGHSVREVDCHLVLRGTTGPAPGVS